MKRKYHGFELDAKREKCLAGYNLLYYTIYDESGREWDCSFEDSEDTELTKIKDLIIWVDEFYEQIKNGICPECQKELSLTMNKNWYCEDCDEYYEVNNNLIKKG